MRVNADLLVDGDVSGNLNASQLLTGMAPPARIFQTILDRQEGAITNWTVPGLAGKNTYIDWDGNAAVQLQGLVGGVPGQRVVIHNRGAGLMTFAHASGTTAPENRFINFAGSIPTPVSTGGTIEYLYYSGGWYIVSHEQGGWISFTPTIVATGGTATVDTVTGAAYRVQGKAMQVSSYVNVNMTVAGRLRMTIPNGVVPTLRGISPGFVGGALNASMVVQIVNGDPQFYLDRDLTGAHFPTGVLSLGFQIWVVT